MQRPTRNNYDSRMRAAPRNNLLLMISSFFHVLALLHLVGLQAAAAAGKQQHKHDTKVFREYFGVSTDVNVHFTDVPIPNEDIEMHFILSFAIDYEHNSDGSFSSTNGNFLPYWNNASSIDTINAIKSKHKNVKVMMSIGGDSIGNAKNATKVEFNPHNSTIWLQNAIYSLTRMVEMFHLDGIDIDYEHFHTDPSTFAYCIGEMITHLKKSNTITIASIAPFDSVQLYYQELWESYGSIFDYVNFQFYTYDTYATTDQLIDYYEKASSIYKGGKVLPSFSTDPDAFSPQSATNDEGITPKNMIMAYSQIQLKHSLGGIFMWVADTSISSNFTYEKQALDLIQGTMAW